MRISTIRSRPIVRRLAAVPLAIAIALGVGAGVARADTINQNPSLHTVWTWGDCTMDVGYVPDSHTPWAAIGGATMRCAAKHTISATVVLKFNGVTVPGSGHSTNQTNYGFGVDAYGAQRVLETPRFCGYGYWQTVMTVSVAGWGQTFVTSGSPDLVKTAC